MALELQNGVHLHVLPTKKYKTNRIFLRFTARHEKTAAAKRTLLTSLLETNSKNYPTQTALSSRLAELYGASFGINVGKRGNLHQVNVGMTIVNGNYVQDQQVFKEAVAFLNEILFFPNVQEDAFDEGTFRIEKENILAYLKSIGEDKQTYASLKIQQLFFGSDPDQKTPSFGTVEDLEKLTAKDLYQTYQKMMTEDQIDIFVVGDITENEAAEAFNQLTFPKTERVHPEIFYTQERKQVIAEEIEREPVVQAKLNLGYHVPIYYDDRRRFALMVFNGLFGGFPHSKLFMNVREKASLAYYASSNFDSFRGLMTVQTGIDGKNRERVLGLIHQQLISLQKGEITEEELAQTKAMLKNQYLLSLDNPQSLIEINYLDSWMPQTKLSEEEFLQRLAAVTKEEVQGVADELELQAVFFLDGENEHA